MIRATSRLVLLCALVGCAPRNASPPPTPSIAGAVPGSIAWSRQSAEHDALFVQTFRLAGERLTELARGQTKGAWAVILDADETILDNSIFEERRALTGTPYSESDWEDYVREEIASALPGARDFVRHVRNLGGRVAIVSNRGPDVCAATRSNLRKLELDPDILLCRPPASSDKNARFRAIQNGTAAQGMAPLRVLMWLGDNIEDFPGLTQSIRTLPDSVYARFGRDYFVLPNPMYGSWQK